MWQLHSNSRGLLEDCLAKVGGFFLLQKGKRYDFWILVIFKIWWNYDLSDDWTNLLLEQLAVFFLMQFNDRVIPTLLNNFSKLFSFFLPWIFGTPQLPVLLCNLLTSYKQLPILRPGKDQFNSSLGSPTSSSCSITVIYWYKVRQVQQEIQNTKIAWYFGGQKACLEYRILTSCRTETWNLDSCVTSQCLDHRMNI